MGLNRSIVIVFQNASTSDALVGGFSPSDGWASGQAPEQGQLIASRTQIIWTNNLPIQQPAMSFVANSSNCQCLFNWPSAQTPQAYLIPPNVEILLGG